MKNIKLLIYLFLFFTFIILPDWIEVFLTDIPLKMAMGELIRAYLVLFVPFLLFISWYRIYLFILLMSASILNLFDMGFLYLYKTRMDQVAFDVAMRTNIQEAMEYTDGYRLVLFITSVLYVGILYFLYRKIQFKSKKPIYIFSLLSCVALLLMTYRSTQIIYNKSVTTHLFSTVFYNNILTTNSPYLILKYFLKYREKEKELDKYIELKKNFLFHSKKRDNVIQTHVLVIGESSRYDHWSINGYSKKTSPHLENEKNLITLSNVVTGAGATNWAVPLMISAQSALDFEQTLKESSLVGAYSEAKYKTYWLSNQDWFPYLNVHINESHEQYFLKEKDKFAYDGNLLDKFSEVLEESKGENRLIVLHIMGSHWRYDKRNPKKFDIFHPSINRESFLRMDDYSQKNKIINSYDNTVYYNDYFLSQLFMKLKEINQISTVTFVADHGENLYDTKEHKFGHGREVNSYVYRIPYFFWYSNRFKDQYPEKIKLLTENKNVASSTATNLFYTMLDLASIDFPDMNFSKSLFSSSFTEETRFVLQGLKPVDYDQLIQDKEKSNVSNK